MVEVKIYGDDGCHACKTGKKYLDEHKIKYKEVDAVDNLDDLVKLTGDDEIGIPVLCVGDKCTIGFNKEKWGKMLKV